MLALRHTRSNPEPNSKDARSKSINCAVENNINPNVNTSDFDQFGNFETIKQTNVFGNDSINEGTGLCGSTYVPSPETVQLNVDNLDFEIKSTKNLGMFLCC